MSEDPKKNPVDQVPTTTVKTAKVVHNILEKYYVNTDHIHNFQEFLPKEELEKLAKNPELLKSFILEHPNLLEHLEKLRTIGEETIKFPVFKEVVDSFNVLGTKICHFDNTVARYAYDATVKVAPQFARQCANAVKVVGPTMVILDACLMVKDVVKAEEYERSEVFLNRFARIVVVGGGVALLSGVPVAGPIAGSFIGKKIADWIFPDPGK